MLRTKIFFSMASQKIQKIAIPNNTKLSCLAWNREDGYIAVGGENGLLKILKLDAAGGENESCSRSRGLTASSNLSMNQTLEGHTENIQVITWNESHRKLTTSDQNGVIIVWMIYKNAWYEEMINNRKKSTVVGMAWSSDGLKICIIYEDGAVIVGSVDGNRIWGKELKGVMLSGVQWSPDGKLLLFTLRNGEVHLYDNQGNFTMRIEVQCISDISEPVSIVGLDWYDGKHGYIYTYCPSLAIAYENGRIQLMCNETDTAPVVVDTGMNAVHCRWNHNGSALAIAGYQIEEDKNSNIVQFYNPFGEHIRTLKVPGKSISCCDWEGGSLRVALAVDSYVFFANIRPDYKWCYLKKTIVFTACRPQRAGICVSFWDTTNNQTYRFRFELLEDSNNNQLGIHKNYKYYGKALVDKCFSFILQCHFRYVTELFCLAGYGDHCVLVIKSETEDNGGKYGLLLCNTLGTPIDGKYTDLEIQWVTMNSSHVIAASKDHFLIWQYRTPKPSNTGINRGKYRLYHIDDSPSGAVEVIQDLEEIIEEHVNVHSSSNPICCLTASEKCLIVGRESGILHHYALPHIALINKYKTNSRPHKIAINCNSSRLAIIDISGMLSMIDISEHLGQINVQNETNKLERKDVWAMCWASDNPQLLAVMEKTRMYVFKGVYPEEPMASSGYICCFQDLEIQAVLLDDIMETPESPSKEFLISLEVKSLRDTRQLLAKVGINETAQFIEDNAHPRLWRLLAEAAVKKLNLVTAESAFIRSFDYPGIQFIKKLQEINCDQLKKAVAAIYFKQFDEAEKLFLDSDRRDLALDLRQTLGDWFRVVQIMKMGVRGSDIQLENAWNSIGNYFYDRRNWEGAREYYEKGRNQKLLIQCYYALEDFDALESMIGVLSERHPLLSVIAEMFVSVGLCSAAVAAFTKFGDVYSAVNLCVKLNEWDLAISLAKQNNLPQISDLLSKYGIYLMNKNCLGEAVELFLKANRFLEAAKIVYQLAKMEAKKHTNALKIKKFFVYAALLVEEYMKIMNSAFKDHGKLNEIANDDLDIIESAWHGAEAYHLLGLVHFYLHDGQIYNAMIAALRLRDFDDVISAEELYCLLAVTSCLNNSFNVCSKALIKLESLEQLTNTEKQEYEEIAIDIFTKHGLKDYHVNRIECSNCETLIPDWCFTCPTCYTEFPTCMVSGKPLTDIARIWTCPLCKHNSSERDMTLRNSCPLCHTSINY